MLLNSVPRERKSSEGARKETRGREKMPKKESSGGGGEGIERLATEERQTWPVRRKLPSVVPRNQQGYPIH